MMTSGGEGGTERASVHAGISLGAGTQLRAEFLELVERRIHAGKGELALDDAQIELPE